MREIERREREREREKGKEGENKEEKDRRKGCTYCIGHDAIIVVPSAPLSYARSERDYLARRERANIGSYSSRLYGAYVPTGFLRAHFHLPIRYPALPLQPFASRPAAIPHADIYTAPVCSLYFWLREKFDISVGPGQLSRGGAIYRPSVSVARKSFAIKDPLSLTRYL